MSVCDVKEESDAHLMIWNSIKMKIVVTILILFGESRPPVEVEKVMIIACFGAHVSMLALV